MTLADRMAVLARLTLQDPRQGARALFSEGVPFPARTAGLLLVAVVSAVLASLQIRLDPEGIDPLAARMLASPFLAAAVQWVLLALSVVLIARVGQAFGGRGTLADALLLVVWLQCLAVALQLLQLIANVIAPPLAGIIGLGGFVLFLWLMTNFIAELHGFRSLGLVFVGMVLSAIAAGILISMGLILLFGQEAFLSYV